MLKVTYEKSDIERHAINNDLRLLPIKNSIYYELMQLVHKVHGNLQLLRQSQISTKFNWNQGMTSYTLFDTFEIDWLNIMGKNLNKLT